MKSHVSATFQSGLYPKTLAARKPWQIGCGKGRLPGSPASEGKRTMPRDLMTRTIMAPSPSDGLGISEQYWRHTSQALYTSGMLYTALKYIYRLS